MNKEPVQNGGCFQPDTPVANFAFWAKLSNWSADEFASLLMGLNPYLMNNQRLLEGLLSEFEDEYHSLSDLTWRWFINREIKPPYTPAKWVALAKKNGIHVPPKLEAAVAKDNGPVQATDSESAQTTAGIEPPSAVEAPKQIPKMQAAILKLADELWPNGNVPVRIGERDDAIIKAWKGKASPNPKTIGRAFKWRADQDKTGQ